MYTLKQLAEASGGHLISNLSETATNLTHLLVDSRKVTEAESSLFIAIKGEQNDGHRFIRELFDAGVRNFLVSFLTKDQQSLKANFIVVENTLNAVQKIAAFHRSQFNIPVIGITGSNGKTVVKEWLYQLLRQDKNIVRSPKSYNSQIGVPLSVWQMSKENDLAIFEAGISKPGEMERLERIIHPTIGLITNIGQAHNENFQSLGEKVTEKLKLFSSCETIIYCKDYSEIAENIKPGSSQQRRQRLISWSRKSNADLVLSKITKSLNETCIQGIYKNDFLEIKIPFSDDASFENAVHCWTILLYLGYDNETIAQRMELLSPVAMRLEMKEGINNCSIINDSYNSDLGSLAIALDFLNQQKQHPGKTVVLSDILQSGKNEAALYKEVAELVSQKGINRIIGIGTAISAQEKSFSGEKYFYKTTDEFLKKFQAQVFRDETILLKGARTFGFERISKILQQKAHQTILEINLNAIAHNLHFYRSRLKPTTKIMGMVKAFSYGSGSFEIASALQFHRADYLAVAYADEGVALRRKGITLPILVMNPEEQSFDAMLEYRLEPEIYSLRILTLFAETVMKSARYKPSLLIPVHLKIDTGMHRLGFTEEEIQELIVRIKNYRNLKIQTIFSHLAASDEQSHDAFTKHQGELFLQITEKIQSQFDYSISRHMLNSAGILRFPEFQFDMVRLGIGLYGIAPTNHEQKHLQNVGTLKTTISQIKNIPPNESIGYSRNAIAKKNIVVATVAIGYADGIPRKLGNGAGNMLINGKFAPTIGNICMDMCMLDITDITAMEGDEVIVFGNEYPVYQFAKDAGMIPYEALTGISQRVKRVYFQE